MSTRQERGPTHWRVLLRHDVTPGTVGEIQGQGVESFLSILSPPSLTDLVRRQAHDEADTEEWGVST